MKEGFGPLIPGFKTIGFNDKNALHENINNALDKSKSTPLK